MTRLSLTILHYSIVLKSWGKSTVILGSNSDWAKSMRNVNRGKSFLSYVFGQIPQTSNWKNVEIGVERALSGVTSAIVPEEDTLFLQDGKGRIRKMWGGYSPKVYDCHWLEIWKDWFEENLKGAGVIADTL